VPLLPTFLPFLFVKEGGSFVRSGFFELARGGIGEGRVSWQTMLGCWASWWCTPRLWKWRFPLPWSWWRSLIAIGHKESQANPPTSAWRVSANYPCILERLVSLVVQLVKFLISKSRHVVWYKGGSLRIGEQEHRHWDGHWPGEPLWIVVP
jgi:hypothetical protein